MKGSSIPLSVRLIVDYRSLCVSFIASRRLLRQMTAPDFKKKNYLGIVDIDCTNEWAEESGCKAEAGDGTVNKREFRRQLHEMG